MEHGKASSRLFSIISSDTMGLEDRIKEVLGKEAATEFWNAATTIVELANRMKEAGE